MKKLVIFDLDGTLFDTTVAMRDCGNYALSKVSLPLLSKEDYARCSGGGVEGFVKAVLSAAGDDKAEHFDAFWQYYLEKSATLTKEANVPYDGIPQLLYALKEKGVLLAVLSNKDQASCTKVVEKAFGKNLFDVIFGNREDTPPKPHPAGVEKILEMFSVSPCDCLYVGDTEVDMETGQRAGIDRVAVLWGYRTKLQLSVFQPEHMIKSPSEILSLL